MTITAVIVVFAVIWFLTFLVVLPIGHVSQDDAGEVEPGTPASAPAGAVVRRKALITTAVTVVLWAIVVAIILSGAITVRDFDWLGVMGPEKPAVSP